MFIFNTDFGPAACNHNLGRFSNGSQCVFQNIIDILFDRYFMRKLIDEQYKDYTVMFHIRYVFDGVLYSVRAFL